MPSSQAVALTFACGLAVLAAPAIAQQEAKDAENPPAISPEQEKALRLYQSISWQKGPGVAGLGDMAQIKIPDGYQFTGKEGGWAIEELTENPRSENLLGVLTPANSLEWFIVFQFNDTGYIRDDEKDKIDADAILQSIRAGTEESNKIRRSKGWLEVQNLVWQQPPAYDPSSHNLVWAISAESEGHRSVNYSTRILGRRGVINANLVCDPNQYATVVPPVKKLLSGLEYKAGLRYAEYRTGDKVAEYGLTALITGGVAAAAIKTGLLSKLGVLLAKSGKLIFGGIAAIIAAIFGTRKKSQV